jgi:4'-phosphopantetheinyl transferase
MSHALVVHVFYARASEWTADAVLRDEALLEANERERAARFHFESDRRMYVGAHALLRRALSAQAPVDPAAWRFVRSHLGRPEIAEPPCAPRLRFSLSHTRAIAACAVVPELDVGFDVEEIRPAPLDVARRFAPAELADITSCRPEERDERFFSYWTLKESYMKARGLGLAIPLDRAVFDPSSATVRASFGAECQDDARDWRFVSWSIEGAYRAALAVKTRREVRIDLSTP